MSFARDSKGLSDLARGLCDYLHELNEMHSICAEHQEVAGIHSSSSKALEVYKIYPTKSEVADHLRKAVKKIPKWSELTAWKYEGDEWEKTKREIISRVKKHAKQNEVFTEGVEWLGRPILIHAYKFEPDPVIKIELVIPHYESEIPEHPLKLMSAILQCHDYLVPTCIAKALPPYTNHEAKFQTVSEYLTGNAPKGIYSSSCFPQYRVENNDVSTEDALPTPPTRSGKPERSL